MGLFYGSVFRRMLRRWILVVFGVLILVVGQGVFGREKVLFHKVLSRKVVDVGGLKREFWVYEPKGLPKDKKVPVVFVYHGGGGNPFLAHKLGFGKVAEREKFVIVYPKGVGGNFNDGRAVAKSKAHREKVDDLAFVGVMLEEVRKLYKVDERRVFSTGISNGGFMSNYLAMRYAKEFAAIAPVVGGIAEVNREGFKPADGVSVFVIQGTEDPAIPYAGGVIPYNRGKIMPTADVLALWRKSNGTGEKALVGKLPDAVKGDGCTVDTFLWKGGKKRSVVQFYRVNGGGHTWPGGKQYLPKKVIGNLCEDFDATEAIWAFFKGHPKGE